MEMILDKKQIQVIFFFKSARLIKQWRQLATSTTHLALELLMNVQWSDGSRSFAKEMRTLKMINIVAGHQKLTTTSWEQLMKLILLQLHQRLPKNSTSTILWSFSIWSKLKSWKSLISGCLMNELTTNQKNYHLKVLSSLISHNNKPFLNQMMTCNKNLIVCDNHWQSAQ